MLYILKNTRKEQHGIYTLGKTPIIRVIYKVKAVLDYHICPCLMLAIYPFVEYSEAVVHKLCIKSCRTNVGSRKSAQ